MFLHNRIASPTPDDENAPIGRYMGFTQFVFLLEKECLHFTRPDMFAGPFEGAVPRRLREKLIEEYAKSGLRQSAGGPHDWYNRQSQIRPGGTCVGVAKQPLARASVSDTFARMLSVVVFEISRRTAS